MSRIRRFAAMALIAVLPSLAVSAKASAETIRVPADAPTITDAINAAVDGDTVLVAPGTYSEMLRFFGKAITVTSERGPLVTIISGVPFSQSLAAVWFIDGEGPDSVLSGFTIAGAPGAGSGILIGGTAGASPTILGNRIIRHTSCYDGVGIAVGKGSPIIKNNLISRNYQSASCFERGSGGAIAMRDSTSTAQIIGNVIERNAVSYGASAGISVAGSPLIQGNLIRNNRLTSFAESNSGAGISLATGGSPTQARIIQNVITGNRAGKGAGLSIAVHGTGPGPLVSDNTIANNYGATPVYVFGAMDRMTLVNNVISAGPFGAPLVHCKGDPAVDLPPVFLNNNVFVLDITWQNLYSGVCTDQTGLDGNLSVDPLYANPVYGDSRYVDPSSGDYRPVIGSPLIDAGGDVAPDLPATDFAGNPRVLDGLGDGVPRVDIGAYEFDDRLLARTGPDLTIATSASAVLDGRGSFDPRGYPLTYSWQLDGVEIATGATPRLDPFPPGVYTIGLTVTDIDGVTASDVMTLTVIDVANELPVANAGPDQNITIWDYVILDGSLSSDFENRLHKFEWTLNGKPIGTSFNASSQRVIEVENLREVGTYNFTLTVTDMFGAIDTDTVVVTVVNQLPVARAGSDRTVNSSQVAALYGGGSFDPDATPLTYEWSLDGVTLSTDPNPDIGPMARGIYTITLTVTDADGGSGTDSMILTVVSSPPVADAEPYYQTVLTLDTVTLDGTATTDRDGDPITYVWSLDGQEIATGPTPQVGPFDNGVYTITLTAIDGDGGGSTSDSIFLNVVNRPPMANAGADFKVSLVKGKAPEITLDGSASFDPDGTIVSYQWILNGTVIATGPTPTVALEKGTYTLTLSVVDDDWGQGKDQVVVTIGNGGGA